MEIVTSDFVSHMSKHNAIVARKTLFSILTHDSKAQDMLHPELYWVTNEQLNKRF